MMGKKKLGTIRAEVREAFASAGIDPDQWFEEEIRKLGSRPSPDQGVIEALQKLRGGSPPERPSQRPKRNAGESARASLHVTILPRIRGPMKVNGRRV